MTQYRGTVTIDSRHRKLDAKIQVCGLDISENNQAVLYLPTETTVHKVLSDVLLDYSVQVDEGWSPFILGSKRLNLTFSKTEQKNILLEFHYTSYLQDLPDGGMNQWTDDLIELGIYTPWFPLQPHFPLSEFDIFIEDHSLFYIGSDTQCLEGGWRLKSPKATVGFPIIGSSAFEKNIRYIHVKSSQVRLIYSHEVNQDAVNDLYNEIESIINLYVESFGTTEIENVDIYLSSRKNTDNGGGYCRPGLIVIPCGSNEAQSLKYTVCQDQYLFKYLSHELGHLWWNKAPVNTWENWLNESFAEYASLLALRALKSEDDYNVALEKYKNESEGLGPIVGCGAENENHFEVWYMKGPFVLSQLEAFMGRDSFMSLLKKTSRQELSRTSDLLEIMSEKDRDYLANLIGFNTVK